MPGSSMDLTTGWDFTKSEDRKKAWKQIIEEQPFMIIGSPPCTLFSVLQAINTKKMEMNEEWTRRFKERLDEAEQHVRFCCTLYRHQLKNGRHFLHEHPWSASSWRLDCVEELSHDSRVTIVRSDLCRYGMTGEVPGGDVDHRAPVKKPTGFMTSAWCMAEELNLKCDGSHEHVHLQGSKMTQAAAIYPERLCAAIVSGIVRQKEHDKKGLATTPKMGRNELKSCVRKLCSMSGRGLSSMVKVVKRTMMPGREDVKKDGPGAVRDDAEKRRLDSMFHPPGGWNEAWLDKVHEDDENEAMAKISQLMMRDGIMWATDDVNGMELDPKAVKAARKIEMEFFKKMKVYTIVPESHQRINGGKIIDVRWIDINKGDKENPNMRSRLVGREFNQGKDDTLYAATPPLEALRAIISWAATQDADEGERREIMVNDVSRAYFYAKATRDIYIRLPSEDPDAQEGMLGKLNLCLYGTRDAAKGWQETLSAHLTKNGFVQGRGFPSLFHHPERDIRTLVHGDDYFSSGKHEDLQWLKNVLEKEYEIKTQVVGMREGSQLEGKILNRIVRCTPEGWEYEADPRHSELIMEQLGTDKGKSVITPGIDDDKDEDKEDEEKLAGEEASKYRGVAARCNYLAMDRPDIQYAVKEVCRDMSNPMKKSIKKLRRIGQYLKSKPRMVWKYKTQAKVDTIDLYTDANWAGCKRTRKSTSGGAVMIGQHCIRTWSKTQAVVAKSSAESELYAAVRTGCEALGTMTMMKELGKETEVRIHIDASAAKGILERTGLHKVRHLDVDMLWMQAQAAKDLLKIKKVDGDKNLADLMTKNMTQSKTDQLVDMMGLVFRAGRSDTAAKLYSTSERGDDVGGGDLWVSRGSNGSWARLHKVERSSLFAPNDAYKGPRKVASIRRTSGRYADGEKFCIVDDWSNEASRHTILSKPWKGMTEFLEITG